MGFYLFQESLPEQARRALLLGDLSARHQGTEVWGHPGQDLVPSLVGEGRIGFPQQGQGGPQVVRQQFLLGGAKGVAALHKGNNRPHGCQDPALQVLQDPVPVEDAGLVLPVPCALR